MAKSICLSFDIHSPYFLKRTYNVFSIGKEHSYYDQQENENRITTLARRSFYPTTKILLDLIEKHKGNFKFSLYVSGTAIELLERYEPEVLNSLKKLVDTNCVELLLGPYYESLSYKMSPLEFEEEVNLHRLKIQQIFSRAPTTFRNAGYLYNSSIDPILKKFNINTILAKFSDISGLFKTDGNYNLLISNKSLEQDLTDRFSNTTWDMYPLTSEQYASWIHSSLDDVVGIFIPMETIGEINRLETDIFSFLNTFPDHIQNKDFKFILPSELKSKNAKLFEERDDIIFDSLQSKMLELVYSFEGQIRALNNKEIMTVWRKLLAIDNFYEMHSLDTNSPKNRFYDSPYDAYMVYINILNDLKHTLNSKF